MYLVADVPTLPNVAEYGVVEVLGRLERLMATIIQTGVVEISFYRWTQARLPKR